MVWTILKHRPPPVDIFCHTNRSANSMAMITVNELTENALDMTILTLFYHLDLSATSGGDPALSGSATSGGCLLLVTHIPIYYPILLQFDGIAP